MHLKDIFKGKTKNNNEFLNHSDSANSILESKKKQIYFNGLKKITIMILSMNHVKK